MSEMIRHRSWLFAAAIVTVLFCVFPCSVHAYIDPGTGSYLFQVLLAVFLGALFVLKSWWMKVVIFFRDLFFRTKGRRSDNNQS